MEKRSATTTLDHWQRERAALTRHWPSLLRALPTQVHSVSHGAAIGLGPAAVVIHRDWLTHANPPELRSALLHLSAHAALGHRPWRWHPAALDAALDQAAEQLLSALGVDETSSQWHDDHHGTWPGIPVTEPGESLMAQAAPQPPDTEKPDAAAEPSQDLTADQPSHETHPAALAEFDAQQAERVRPQSLLGRARSSGASPAIIKSPSAAPIHWRAVLPFWLGRQAHQHWQFSRPARRQAPPFILPRLGGRQLTVVVAIDISGSIAPEWIGQFLNELDPLRSQVPLQLRLITCDNRIHHDARVQSATPSALAHGMASHGGGGTDFRPVFERLAADAAVDALIYCTDLAGQFPAHAPRFPVFWLIPNSLSHPGIGNPAWLKPPPFGQILST